MRSALRRHIIAAVILVLSACGGGGGGGSGAGSVEPDSVSGPAPEGGDYFPLGSGDRWLYRVDDNGIVNTYQSEVGASTTVGGRARTELVTATLDGTTVDVSSYASTAAGVTAFPTAGDPFSGAVGSYKLLRLPATLGDSFVQVNTTVDSGIDVDSDGVNERLQILAVVRVVERTALSTPAGNFTQALHLRTTIDETLIASRTGARRTAKAILNDWFDAGVGRLRSDMTITVDGFVASSRSSELLAFRAGNRHGGASPVVTAVGPDDVQLHNAGAAVSAGFTVPMDVGSLDAGGFTVTDAAGQPVPGHTALAPNRLSAAFIPNAGWYSGTFTARITASATDRYGNAATPLAWTFRLDAVAPAIVQATPADGATGVASDARLTYGFSEPLDAATVAPGGTAVFSVTDDTSGASAPATLSFDGVATVRIAPRTYWPHDHRYTIHFPGSIRDLPGNPLGAPRQIHFSTAASRFAPAIPIAADVGSQPLAAIGDIDGDGLADLVWTQWDFAPFPPLMHLFVRRGLPGGGFGPASEPIAAPVYPCGLIAIAIGDTDGDGRQDLVLGGSCGIRVLLQDVGGTFRQGPQYALPGYDYAAAVKLVDLNGDGRLDMLSAGNSSAFRVWLQTAPGVFTQTALVETGLGSLVYLQVADLDGDARVDVVATSIGMQAERLAVLRGLPGGAFGPPTAFVTGDGSPYGLAVGDADGDRRPDVVVAIGGTDTPRVLIFHQAADHGFALSATIPLSLEPVGVHLMDIDGDGTRSLVVGHAEAFAVLPALGSGQFGAADYYEARRAVSNDGWMAMGLPDSRGQSLLAFNGQVFAPKAPAGSAAPKAVERRLAQEQRESAAALTQAQGAYRASTIRRLFARPDNPALQR